MRLRLPFALLSVTKARFTREFWREKWTDTRALASLFQQHDRIKPPQFVLIGFGRFHPVKSLASRQLGASMDLDPGAARRLREALDILASGELPECPVCKPPRA